MEKTCKHTNSYIVSDEGDGILIYCPGCEELFDENMDIVPTLKIEEVY